jgi:hypothetical protein
LDLTLSVVGDDDAQDVVALIAYQQPNTSPVAHFLSVKHREEVAEALNSAILGTCVVMLSSLISRSRIKSPKEAST